MNPENQTHDEFLKNNENIIIQTTSLNKIPEKAVVLSKAQAVNLRLQQMYKWRPKSDVWAVRYGPWILGACSLIPSVYITQYFRRKLKLRSQGYYTVYSAMIYGPLFMTIGIHYQVITVPLAALNSQYCPICFETKASLIQGVLSTFYPVVLAGFSNLMFATRHGTVHDIPYYKDYKGMFKHFIQLSKPLLTRLSIFFIGESILANFITYMEGKQMYYYQEKLIKLHKNKVEK